MRDDLAVESVAASSPFPVGHPARVTIGRAIRGPILLAVGFVGFVVAAKEFPAGWWWHQWCEEIGTARRGRSLR